MLRSPMDTMFEEIWLGAYNYLGMFNHVLLELQDCIGTIRTR